MIEAISVVFFLLFTCLCLCLRFARYIFPTLFDAHCIDTCIFPCTETGNLLSLDFTVSTALQWSTQVFRSISFDLRSSEVASNTAIQFLKVMYFVVSWSLSIITIVIIYIGTIIATAI